MNTATTQPPEASNGNQSTLTAETKKDFSARYQISLRTTSSLLASGLPHMKLSERQIRIPVAEADDWMSSRYLTQRRKKVTA